MTKTALGFNEEEPCEPNRHVYIDGKCEFCNTEVYSMRSSDYEPGVAGWSIGTSGVQFNSGTTTGNITYTSDRFNSSTGLSISHPYGPATSTYCCNCYSYPCNCWYRPYYPSIVYTKCDHVIPAENPNQIEALKLILKKKNVESIKLEADGSIVVTLEKD